MKWEWEYEKSRIILVLGSIIFCLIALVNEDASIKIFVTIIFAGVTFFVSFLGTIVSRKMLETGDKIPNRVLRFFYYILLFIGIVVAAFLIYYIVLLVGESDDSSQSLSAALSEAIMLLLTVCVFVTALFVPYLQTLIVICLRPVKKRMDVKKEKLDE